MHYLYVLAGFPGKGLGPGGFSLNPGGLRYGFCACDVCCEDRRGEPLEVPLLLEHDANFICRKGGVVLPDDEIEGPHDVEFQYRISDVLLQAGITWDWFRDGWIFGQGITCHATMASPEYRTVIHGTDITLDEFKKMNRGNPYRESDLLLVDEHWRHNGWKKYEARWLPGTCPQDTHIVHLTWLITTHKLPEFVYERLRDIIEYRAEPKQRHLYDPTPNGKHLSTIRRYDGKPAFRRG